jgi:zinc transporter ZupT
MFHQSVLVVVGYFVFKFTNNTAIQVMCILAAAIIFTFAIYELFKQIKPLRWMFALKK